jgi:hypothetical protein
MLETKPHTEAFLKRNRTCCLNQGYRFNNLKCKTHSGISLQDGRKGGGVAIKSWSVHVVKYYFYCLQKGRNDISHTTNIKHGWSTTHKNAKNYVILGFRLNSAELCHVEAYIYAN